METNARVALEVDADRFHALFKTRVLDFVRDYKVSAG